MTNWFNNAASTAKSRAATSTVTLLVAEEDAPSFGVASKSRRKRVLTPVQIFSKQYYNTLVKPTVEAKLLALAGERTVSRGERISLRSTETELAWTNTSEEIRAEILKLHLGQKDTKLDGSDRGDDDDDDGDDDDNDQGNDKDKKVPCQELPKDKYLTGQELER